MRWILVSCLAILLSACGDKSAPQQTTDARTRADSPAPTPAPAPAPGEPPEGASAQLAATQGNEAHGSLALASSPQGVRIMGVVQGLRPNGEFGFHVHEKGDCSAADASSAGAHFNPTDQPHGDPRGAADRRHLGDMVNLRSDAQGVANVETTIAGATLHTGEPTDILGKAIVVHEKPDDYQSQPSGDSGSRIACGVIGIAAANVQTEADSG